MLTVRAVALLRRLQVSHWIANAKDNYIHAGTFYC